jgi:hypothetical protein
MLGLIAFAGLLIAGFAFMAVMGMVFLVLKIVLWTVFLPLRLLFKLMWLPVALIGGLFSVAAGAAILPIVLTIGLAVAAFAVIAAAVALLLPAIPFVLLGLVVWAMLRRSPQATVVG